MSADVAPAPYTCRTCAKPAARPLQRGLCGACRAAEERQSLQAKASDAVRGLLGREDILILDTETTGMGKRAEVIEVAVVNTRGETLLDTLVKPKSSRMNPYAQRVHGITSQMLQDAPAWSEVLPELAELADRRTVLAWNAPFDRGMLEQTSHIWGLSHPAWLFVCAMRLYAKGRGIKNRGLQKVLVDEQLTHLHAEHKSHRALGDTVFVLEVLRALGGNKSE